MTLIDLDATAPYGEPADGSPAGCAGGSTSIEHDITYGVADRIAIAAAHAQVPD